MAEQTDEKGANPQVTALEIPDHLATRDGVGAYCSCGRWDVLALPNMAGDREVAMSHAQHVITDLRSRLEGALTLAAMWEERSARAVAGRYDTPVSHRTKRHAEQLRAVLVGCCDLHGRNCEPPSELCCERCTEGAHPDHRDGSVCSNPDLTSRPAQPTPPSPPTSGDPEQADTT